jgi:hypothetical protein
VLAVMPREVTLDGGRAQQVFIQIVGNVDPKSANYILRVAAKDEPSKFETTIVHVTDTCRAKKRLLLLFGIVLVGAGISLIINNVFPVTATKSRFRMAIAQLEAQIRGSSRVSAALRSALLEEATRGRLLTDNLSWYNSSKDEDMAVIERALDTLRGRVSVVETISASRLHAEQAHLLPVTARYEIEEMLRRAEEAVSDGHLDAAKAHVDAATQLRDRSVAPQALGTLRTRLEEDIRLLSARPELPSRDPRAKAMLAQLESARSRLKDMAVPTLLETERDYNALYTYVETGEAALERNPNDEGMAQTVATFLDLLTADSTASQVVWLRKMLDSDLSLQAVAASVKARAGHIACSTTPRVLELNDYRFEFSDPRIAAVPGVAQLAGFEWNFQDGTDTSQPNVNHRKHSYETRIAGRFPWQRRWPKKLTISVMVTAPLSDVRELHERELRILPARDAGWGLFGMHALRFGVTSLIGVCAAFGSQYAVAPDDMTISTAITAFLFGFSLDQIRSKTAPT